MGVVVRFGRGLGVRPIDPDDGEIVVVPPAARRGARLGDVVRLHLRPRGRSRPKGEGPILESLGHLDEPGTDVTLVCERFALRGEFPPEVLERAEALPGGAGRGAGRRERFDDPPPVTIDGETARDFDDAVAVAALPSGGFRLWVHIADVAHFVRRDDALDLEARERGTSVYFPDRVLPMLPERLSNGLCSLVPREDRLVQTAILDIGAKGAVRHVRFADGIIRSAARLTYGRVARLLEGRDEGTDLPPGVAAMLRTADRLRVALEKARHRRGSVDFDLPEPQILLDVEGAITGVMLEPRNLAHRLIEECMLVANQAVAAYLRDRGYPCLYRVHDPPDPVRLSSLARFAGAFGVRLSTRRGTVEPRDVQELLESVEGRPEARIIAQVALRSMSQARYATENSGHFGLAAAAYCHFTSPIRRYPDLVVHRLLRDCRAGIAPGAGHGAGELVAIAGQSSERERNAEAAERELLAWKKAAFIADKVGLEFDGLITGVARFGLFVQLIDSLVEGLVRVETLGQEWFEPVESGFELRGARSGRRFRIGDRVRVRVEAVDRILRRVDFRLAGEPAVERAATRRRQARPRRIGRQRFRAARGARRRR